MLSLITNAFISFLEEEFINYEPEMQQALLAEMARASNSLVTFINAKIESKQEGDLQ